MFKKSISMILFAGLLLSATGLSAQYRSSKKEKEQEKSSFKSKLWYGVGANIGFGAFNGNSSFGIGLAPMVGYKFFGPFSIGPRAAVFFTSQKFRGSKAIGLFDTELGVFLRAKVFRGFFVQGELSNSWEQEPALDANNNLIKSTFQRGNQYLGAGYNWGNGGGGTEISVLYNFALANDLFTSRQPIDYRFAVTWRF
jgi:hypothetical protein